MSSSLRQVIDTFEKLWPTKLAEDWDVVGLVSGSLSKEIKSVFTNS
jgi:putative NIF3 family GTP cyclohydrolase 1 type 2